MFTVCRALSLKHGSGVQGFRIQCRVLEFGGFRLLKFNRQSTKLAGFMS